MNEELNLFIVMPNTIYYNMDEELAILGEGIIETDCVYNLLTSPEFFMSEASLLQEGHTRNLTNVKINRGNFLKGLIFNFLS